jgi:hypothetical protein
MSWSFMRDLEQLLPAGHGRLPDTDSCAVALRQLCHRGKQRKTASRDSTGKTHFLSAACAAPVPAGVFELLESAVDANPFAGAFINAGSFLSASIANSGSTSDNLTNTTAHRSLNDVFKLHPRSAVLLLTSRIRSELPLSILSTK